MKATGDDNPPQESADTTAPRDVLNRVEGEYNEMPGMGVTRMQAQRLDARCVRRGLFDRAGARARRSFASLPGRCERVVTAVLARIG